MFLFSFYFLSFELVNVFDGFLVAHGKVINNKLYKPLEYLSKLCVTFGLRDKIFRWGSLKNE